MYQLRIYTLKTADALERYATVHWPRHIPSLRAFGISTRGIWTEHDLDAHRLIALVSYPDGADPADLTAAYMASPEFAADMEGFDVDNIVDVSEILLDPTASSPLVSQRLDQTGALPEPAGALRAGGAPSRRG
jgi:hypothetical protein